MNFFPFLHHFPNTFNISYLNQPILLNPYKGQHPSLHKFKILLRTKKDFELVQARMLAFVRIQQDWLVQVRDVKSIRKVMKEWEEIHHVERERISNALGYVGGVLDFIRMV